MYLRVQIRCPEVNVPEGINKVPRSFPYLISSLVTDLCLNHLLNSFEIIGFKFMLLKSFQEWCPLNTDKCITCGVVTSRFIYLWPFGWSGSGIILQNSPIPSTPTKNMNNLTLFLFLLTNNTRGVQSNIHVYLYFWRTLLILLTKIIVFKKKKYWQITSHL